MATIVNVNGLITGEREAVVPVLDHGFLYGEGVYETMRTYNGRPFLLDRHLRRLRTSAAMIDLRVPLTDEQLDARIAATTKAAGAEQGRVVSDWYIRVLLTRGVGELSYDQKGDITRLDYVMYVWKKDAGGKVTYVEIDQ